MSTTQKSPKALLFVDYIPAELRENSRWEIIYYAIDPFETNPEKKLKRKRHRVKPMENKTERRKLAKRIINNINSKLTQGWTPFLNEKNVKAFSRIFDVFEIFLNQTQQQYKKEVIRKDTLRSYRSYINNFKIFLNSIDKNEIFINDLTEEIYRDFLDDIFFERDNSATTHNNYLTFLRTFTRWLIKRKYIAIDISQNITKLKTGEKKRTIIPLEIRNSIFEELKKENFNYFILCYTAFYCLTRRTEITKLKVKDVFLKNGIISIPSEVSKNGKSQIVTIPTELLKYLVIHLRKANNEDYFFSENNFAPGSIQLKPKKISDTWVRFRKLMKFDSKYQWYSLKDTGITNYLQLGLPTIDVKNQARHHSIVQTEAYIPKKIMKAVGNIQSAKLDF